MAMLITPDAFGSEVLDWMASDWARWNNVRKENKEVISTHYTDVIFISVACSTANLCFLSLSILIPHWANHLDEK